MGAEIGIFACRVVEQPIKCSIRLDSVWKTADNDNLQSVFACVQIFSDKSETLSIAGGPTFYPLHVTLLNFSEIMRPFQILSGATVLAYFPIVFQ